MYFKQLAAAISLLFIMDTTIAQYPTIRDTTVNMKTYGFGDPNPVADMNRIYPYFRFDTYSDSAEYRDWKMVILENEFIKVFVCPEVGGKVWGAIEKSTGKEFLYFNDVVKFRDVATRGAWTSGGLEYNFGVIGHSPSGATPVDYALRTNADGSVSCVVGAIDLSSRTKWTVEIKLAKERAFFETHVAWMNMNSTPVSFYHWMNAAAKAAGNLEFLYPGKKRIGHGGEVGEWPIDNDRDISWYDNNDFGIYKSYHIINSYSDVFGGYWHDDNFGFGHYATYDDKPGRKIWIWGLSDQGMIWEDLLTDQKGQYIEYQSGKLFNQTAHSSSTTPFKHREFFPHDTERSTEIWFPIKGTKGMVAASEYAVLNMERNGGEISIWLSALQPLATDLVVKSTDDKVITKIPISLSPLELHHQKIPWNEGESFQIELGDKWLLYASEEQVNDLDRPYLAPEGFDWSSAYGWYVKGLELEKQRRYAEAYEAYLQGLDTDSLFAPLLGRMALSYFRKQDHSKAVSYARQAMALDTYDDLANYVYGLASKALGHTVEAKSGFSIASQSPAFRSASFTELAKLHLVSGDNTKALDYAKKALAFNSSNMVAMEINALVLRIQHDKVNAKHMLDAIYQLDATSEFRLFEQYRWNMIGKNGVVSAITNELPSESYLELASRYLSYGQEADARTVLGFAPDHPIVAFWMAYLDEDKRQQETERALRMKIDLIFPHRPETAKVLMTLKETNPHWKIDYYLGLYQWSIGNIQHAKQLFEGCSDLPDEVPFYLAKIRLFSDDTAACKSSLEKATQLGGHQWRTGLAWISFHMRNNQWNDANEKAADLYSNYPDRYDVGLAYAKALLRNGNHRKCLSLLEGLSVLPFEGSTEGRNIYFEACIRSAMQCLEDNDFKGMITFANDAKRWPKNIGVGKPYDVDERLQNYLLSLAYARLGDAEAAKAHLEKVAAHETPGYLNESATAYFQLTALKQLGEDRKLDAALSRFAGLSLTNRYVAWATAQFNATTEAARIRQEIQSQDQVVQAYDTKFVDQDFELVLDIIDQLATATCK